MQAVFGIVVVYEGVSVCIQPGDGFFLTGRPLPDGDFHQIERLAFAVDIAIIFSCPAFIADAHAVYAYVKHAAAHAARKKPSSLPCFAKEIFLTIFIDKNFVGIRMNDVQPCRAAEGHAILSAVPDAFRPIAHAHASAAIRFPNQQNQPFRISAHLHQRFAVGQKRLGKSIRQVTFFPVAHFRRKRQFEHVDPPERQIKILADGNPNRFALANRVIVFVAVFGCHRQHAVPFKQHRLQRAPIAI